MVCRVGIHCCGQIARSEVIALRQERVFFHFGGGGGALPHCHHQGWFFADGLTQAGWRESDLELRRKADGVKVE